MRIILDTNIFCQDYWLCKNNFRIFFSGLQRIPAVLLIPKVVIDEFLNKFQNEYSKKHDSLLASLRECNEISNSNTSFNVSSVEEIIKNHSDSFQRTIARTKAKILEYPKTSHEEIVKFAILRKKPFAENGSGYRDALIWESVKSQVLLSDETVVFISNNTHDFCLKDLLHPDLVGDVGESRIKRGEFEFFKDLGSFNKKYVVPKLESIMKIENELASFNAKGLDLHNWIETKGLTLIESIESDLGVLKFGWEPEIGNFHIRGINKIDDVSTKDILKFNDHEVIISFSSSLEVLFSATASWDEFCNSKAIQSQFPCQEGHFRELWISEKASLKIIIEAIFNLENKEIESWEIKEIIGEQGEISF